MLYQHILLIDDDEDDHEIFISALEQVGGSAGCVVLSSAAKALHQLTSKKVEADVIFLDMNMPVMNGIQFLQEIKKEQMLKDIPVIMYSTSSNPTTIAETKALGAKDFITKPDKIDDLVRILSRLIG